uniref:Cyanocobalamin reductase (cyanide-eliminating) n=1 Tax=Parascaris univalens TaxID=6257 RepID=A0A915AJH4_PARUN
LRHVRKSCSACTLSGKVHFQAAFLANVCHLLWIVLEVFLVCGNKSGLISEGRLDIVLCRISRSKYFIQGRCAEVLTN